MGTFCSRISSNATATIEIDERNVWVQSRKRAHNPLPIAAGFDKTDTRIPWLRNKRLHFLFG